MPPSTGAPRRIATAPRKEVWGEILPRAGAVPFIADL